MLCIFLAFYLWRICIWKYLPVKSSGVTKLALTLETIFFSTFLKMFLTSLPLPVHNNKNVYFWMQTDDFWRILRNQALVSIFIPVCLWPRPLSPHFFLCSKAIFLNSLSSRADWWKSLLCVSKAGQHAFSQLHLLRCHIHRCLKKTS